MVLSGGERVINWAAAEMCMGMGKTWVTWVPRDFHGIPTRMKARYMGMEIKTLKWGKITA